MSRTKKIKILIPLVGVLFLGAYARHKYIAKQIDVPGRLQDKQMNESSGISASGIDSNIYYVHNDSGDTSRFFAITANGALKSAIYYKGDAKARLGVFDVEDIAVGPGPLKGKSYVYLGDIGDNYSDRKYITIYRIEEKASWLNGRPVNADAVPVHLRYPDGPKDAEAMMIDPLEKLIYIVSKRKDTVGVYTTPLSYKANDTLVMTRRSKLFFKGFKPFKWITAGDISKDGKHILLKSYQEIYYWERRDNETVWQAMQRKPFNPHYEEEKLGEAIAFGADGTGFYTTSEGVFAPIYYHKTP